jgi:Flp pilus assembly protein TadG
MKPEDHAMDDSANDRGRERGQIIVIFALGLVAMVAMVGLVLDGGSAFAQRRTEQNAADLAALSGANIYLLTGSQDQATVAARATAASNGFTHGAGGIAVNVTYELTDGAEVTVKIDAPHRNSFVGVLGMTSWTVSTQATAETGIPNGITDAAAPFLFSIDAFAPNGEPLPQYGDPSAPFAFNADNNDAPVDATDIAWTDFKYDDACVTPGNVDASTVADIIDSSLEINTTVDFGCYIGQHNNGNMTTMYSEINVEMIGGDYSVPVVDDGGNFQGWATFHVTGATGGSTKTVQGYFKSPFQAKTLKVGCPDGNCPRYLGTYVLRLIG